MTHKEIWDMESMAPIKTQTREMEEIMEVAPNRHRPYAEPKTNREATVSVSLPVEEDAGSTAKT